MLNTNDTDQSNAFKQLEYLFESSGEDRVDIKNVPGAGVRMVILPEGSVGNTSSLATNTNTEEGKGGEEEEGHENVDINTLVLVGNARLLKSYGVEIPPEISKIALEYRKLGKITIYYSYQSHVRCVIALSDIIRPEARIVVNYLQKKCKITCYMITGDDEVTAHAVAKSVGISVDHVYASAKPTDKQIVVKQLQDFGSLYDGSGETVRVEGIDGGERKGVSITNLKSVCFVGDGK